MDVAMLVASSGGRLIDVGGWNRGLGLQAATVGLNLLRPSPSKHPANGVQHAVQDFCTHTRTLDFPVLQEQALQHCSAQLVFPQS
jgi:hypothetical protein